MSLAKKMRIAVCLGVTLLATAAAQAQSGPLKDEIAQHEQKLAAARESNSIHEETTELNVLGFLYRQAGKMQKALEYLNEALPIEQNGSNQAAQAMTPEHHGQGVHGPGPGRQGAGAVQPSADGLALAGD